MGKVIAVFAMSLDGFIADPENGVHLLFQWFSNGDTPFPVMGRTFMTSAASAAQYRELLDATGVYVTGRGDFDASNGWGGKNPLDVPVFIVTHTPPQEWIKKGVPFTFVTGGVESAIEQGKKAAGDKNVLVGGSKIAQQGLKAGLIDEIQIDLVPVLLGEGIRLFEQLGTDAIEMECVRVIDAPGVTHLRFCIIKSS